MSTAAITAAPAPSCRRTRNAQFGSVLSKWKAMDRQSQRNMYADSSCLVAMATTHGKDKQGRQRGSGGSPSKRFGGSPSQRFGPNPSQRFCGIKNKSSYVRGGVNQQHNKTSVRIFQSKRFSIEVIKSSDSVSSTASTVDLSDSCSAEDPCELIDTKESQAFVLSGDGADSFGEHYSVGKQVCC